MPNDERAALPLSDEILDERGAAYLLKISTATLTNWRLAGRGPPYSKLSGHTVRYSKRRLLDWLESRTVEGAEIKKAEQ
jgi:hypothetical protein